MRKNRPVRAQPSPAPLPQGLVHRLPVLEAQRAFSDFQHKVGSPAELPRVRSHSPNATTATATATPEAAATAALSASVAATVQRVERFIQSELCVLAAKDSERVFSVARNGGGTSPERLAVFKTALQMLLPVIHPTVCPLIEKIVSEHDRFARESEKKAGEDTLHAQKKKIEHFFEQHYNEIAQEQEQDLLQRKKEFSTVESMLTQKFQQMADEVAALKEENARLLTIQKEDHDRITSMAQSVVDSRLDHQHAELRRKEMEQEVRAVKQAQKEHVEMLQDCVDMVRLLQSKNIPFQPRCQVVLEVMNQGKRRPTLLMK